VPAAAWALFQATVLNIDSTRLSDGNTRYEPSDASAKGVSDGRVVLEARISRVLRFEHSFARSLASQLSQPELELLPVRLHDCVERLGTPARDDQRPLIKSEGSKPAMVHPNRMDFSQTPECESDIDIKVHLGRRVLSRLPQKSARHCSFSRRVSPICS